MKWNRKSLSPKGRTRKESSSSSFSSDKQAKAKLELAQEEARRQRNSSSILNGATTTTPYGDLQKLDLNDNAPSNNNRVHRLRTTRHPYARSPTTRSRSPTRHKSGTIIIKSPTTTTTTTTPQEMRGRPNRSSLKDDSEAGKARRRKRCSSISFCDELEIVDIVPAKDLVSNRKQLWWQSSEYEKIVQLSVAIVDLAKRDKKTETRGLEDLMANKEDAFQTRFDVLMAQQILRQRQIQDEEALGGLYQTKTAKYLREAALRAMQDEKEVQQYLADTRRMCRRTWSV